MKNLSRYLLLLLCVSALWVRSTAGSYNGGHPLLVNRKTHPQGQPGLYKRQGSPYQGELCTPIIAALCTNGEFQEYANFLQHCNYSDVAQTVKDTCAHNSMGVYCAGEYEIEFGIDEVCDIFSSTCSPECRDYLIGTRDRLGCCMEFSYAESFLSLCGVESVTEECSSTITLHPTKVHSTCSIDALLTQSASIFCRRRYVEEIKGILAATEECQDFDFDDQCKVNRFGTYCTTHLDDLWSSYTTAYLSCTDNSTCESSCFKALNNISNTIGCCFNEGFNNTNDRDWWLSGTYWSMCNLKSPGLCEVKFIDDPGKPSSINYCSTSHRL